MINRGLGGSVFVIGAGAHVPYGFPTSQQLTSKIKALYSRELRISGIGNGLYSHATGLKRQKIELCRLMRDLELVRPSEGGAVSNFFDIELGEELDKFIHAFGASQVYSIDSYLAKNLANNLNKVEERFAKIGKLLISYFIAKSESDIPVGFHEFDWIQYIIDRFLREKSDRFFGMPPTIFSFNYDNHFERSIASHLEHFHGITKEEAVRKVNSLNIRHVYGDIGSLSFEQEPDTRGFHLRAISNIKVIGEERVQSGNDHISEDFYEAASQADRVYFLGFGFDLLNTRLLFKSFPGDSKSDLSSVKFYSTNVGVTPFEVGQISKRLPVRVDFSDKEGVDSLRLIREVAPI